MTKTSAAIASVLALGALAWPGSSAAPGWTPDRPLRTQVVKGGAGETTCTYYPDMVVQVPDTDTPSPGAATLVRGGKAPPACSARAMPGARLDTAGDAFVGRTGPYLFFEEADPNGTIAFAVIDARTGRAIVDDVTENGLRASVHGVAATPDALRLSFRRGLNTDCSIPAAPAKCWGTITRDKDNRVPPAIARLAPPAQACARGYGKEDRTDPSVIAYEVQVTWSRTGGRQVQASGLVGCTPLP